MTHVSEHLVGERISKSSTFSAEAAIDIVFPLFGPVREKEWAHGWNPVIIYPVDTLVCEKMVFQTSGGLHGSEETYTWSIVRYEPHQYQIEYQVTAAERLWFITVSCTPIQEATQITVTYSYTGWSESATVRNRKALAGMFAHDLKDWEKAINYYLKTGQVLS